MVIYPLKTSCIIYCVSSELLQSYFKKLELAKKNVIHAYILNNFEEIISIQTKEPVHIHYVDKSTGTPIHCNYMRNFQCTMHKVCTYAVTESAER